MVTQENDEQKNARIRRSFLIGWLIVIGLILGGIFWWKHSSREVKEKAMNISMKLVSMAVTDMETDRIKAVNQVIIKNPLPFPLNASRLDYVLMIKGVKVAEGSYTRPIQFPPGNSDIISLPIAVHIAPMEKAMNETNTEGKDSVIYTMINTIHTTVPVAGQRTFQIRLEEKMPVVRLFRMKPADVNIDRLTAKDIELNMVMNISNPNTFSVRMKDIHYSMVIDDKNMMEGTMQETVSLPAGKTTPVAMRLKLKTGTTLAAGWKTVFDKKDTRYQLTFDGRLLSDQTILKNSNMHFNEAGYLYELKEMVKNKET